MTVDKQYRSGEVEPPEPQPPTDYLDGDGVRDPQALEDEHVARRRFLALAAAITMGAVIPTRQPNTESRYSVAVRLSQSDVNRWRVTAAAVHRLACRYGNAACAAALHAALRIAEPLRNAVGEEMVRQQMRSVLAHLHSLAGWSEAYSGSPGSSLFHFGEALRLAREAEGDGQLISQTLCRAGCVYVDQDLPNDALKLFQLGQIAAAECGDGLLIALLCALEAWCYAMLRNEPQAIKLLGRVRHELQLCQTQARLTAAFQDDSDIRRLATTLHELLRCKAAADHRSDRQLRPLPAPDSQGPAGSGVGESTGKPETENQYANVIGLLQDVRRNNGWHGRPDSIDLCRLVERQARRAG